MVRRFTPPGLDSTHGLRLFVVWWLLVSCVVAAACGKKGSPLAPIVRIPAQIDMISARRVGSDVFVTVTVPNLNIDKTIPADLGRIDIYAYTGSVAPPRARFTSLGDVVASIPVVPAPLPNAPAAPPPDPRLGATQGAVVTVREPLTSEDLVQGRVDPPGAIGRANAAVMPVAAAVGLPLRRFYLAIPVSPRGRPGPPGAAADVVLTGIPEAPRPPRITYTATDVTVAWEHAGGVAGYIIDQQLPPEREPFDTPVDPGAGGAAPPGDALPAGPTRYSLYRDVEVDPLALPAAVPMLPWLDVPATPSVAAGQALTITEPVEFERTRCYEVRAVRGVAPALVESDPSPRVCVRLVDVFPPQAPAAPETVAGEGAISLIWEPRDEPDLGGYLVLRGEAGDATLQPLTPVPIPDASFRDTTVVPGRRYVYAVVAIDNRLPLGNVSAPSPRVEETAR